jgi:peptide/nickel transport system ATP-binding protein
MNKPLLHISGLSKTFHLGGLLARGGSQKLRVLNNISLDVAAGETLAIVGESGCGKSTLGRCLLRLMDIDSGQILFRGEDISTRSQAALRPLRRHMQMIFQDPYSSLNPRRRVRELLAEPLLVHGLCSKRELDARLNELMDWVNLPAEYLNRYPHEFSGGQRQRIGIARAMGLSPELIVADESVSALDVSVQAQVVNLMMDLQQKTGLAYVFISHDLGVVRQISKRTAVMYLGGIVELGDTEEVLHRPAHPYTAALVSAVPQVGGHGANGQRIILRGEPPSPLNPPSGCRFHTRCPHAQAICREQEPSLSALSNDRQVACHFPLL